MTVTDLEFRIAYLEDQIDALNREMVLLNRDRNQLTEELHNLVSIVRPLIERMSQLDASDDSAPPPHY